MKPRFEPIPLTAFSGTAQTWGKMTNHVFIPLKDRDALRNKMDALVSVQGEFLGKEQQRNLVESASGILYALGTGDWKTYLKSRVPLPMERYVPGYKHVMLSQFLKIPQSETNQYTLIELHQMFVEKFKEHPFLNSGLLLSSNAFSFSSATQLDQIPPWNNMPDPGEKPTYCGSSMTDYNYKLYEKEELDKQGKVLWGSFTVVGEGNPDGMIRPYRILYIWNTESQCWIPTGFETASADFLDETGEAVKMIAF